MSAIDDASDYFLGRGYSLENTKAIVGNLFAESGLDPNAVGDDGTAFGISQVRGSRKRALDLFAAKRGTSWNDFGTQLAFVDYELRTTERGTYSALKHANTVEESVNAFLGFLRPQGYSALNPQNSHNYSGRMENAENLDSLSGGTGTDTLLGGKSILETFLFGTPEEKAEADRILGNQNLITRWLNWENIASIGILVIIGVAFLILGVMSLKPSSIVKGNSNG